MTNAPRSRYSTPALLLLVFATGAASGVVIDRALAPAQARETRIARDMSGVLDSLGLTEDQRARAEAVLEGSAPRSEEAMREAAARLRQVADSVDATLRAILTPAQRERLDRLRREPTFLIKRKTAGGTTVVDTVRQ
jgi:hypothetical protein